MNTTETTAAELVFSTKEIQDFADLLKANGLKVYISIWSHTSAKPTYFHFTDGINIGYCQLENWGFRFSTIHKPCKEAGTGFSLQNYHEAIANPTIEDAKMAFCKIPLGFPERKYSGVVKKYKNWDEYAAKRGEGALKEY